MYYNLNKKIKIILTISIVILVHFPNSITSINSQTVNNKKPITIGLNLWSPSFLTFVAQEKGIFKKNNVDVNISYLPHFGQALNAYSNGQLDGILTVYSDILIQQSQGVDTKVVYNHDLANKADSIVGNGNNLSDVKGKNLGVERINSYSNLFVLKSLEKAHILEGDVKFVNVPVQNVTSALQKGQIFAGHTYEPFLSDAVKKGYRILSTAADIPGIITTVLAFHSDIVNQRPSDIQNIIKSLIEAKQDYEINKEQDLAIMSQKSGLSKEQIVEGINNVHLLDLNYNFQKSMNKNSNETTSLIKSGSEIVKFYAERGIISEYPKIDDLVDPQFVNTLLKEDSITKFQ